VWRNCNDSIAQIRDLREKADGPLLATTAESMLAPPTPALPLSRAGENHAGPIKHRSGRRRLSRAGGVSASPLSFGSAKFSWKFSRAEPGREIPKQLSVGPDRLSY
jgi:hypothetical protein